MKPEPQGRCGCTPDHQRAHLTGKRAQLAAAAHLDIDTALAVRELCDADPARTYYLLEDGTVREVAAGLGRRKAGAR